MNPTELEPPFPPPQPHRPSTSCDLHPDEHFTGFCPSCLCDRLSLLDPNNPPPSSSSSSRKPPPAASAFLSIFRHKNNPPNNDPSSSSSGIFPELRRSKSFSASKNNNEGLFSGFFEPQRKSCDVRGRSTLWSLFSLDDGRNGGGVSSRRTSNAEASRHSFVGVSGVKGEIFDEEEEEIELTGDYKVVKENIEELVEEDEEEDGIVIEEYNVGGIAAEDSVPVGEIVEEEVKEGRKEAFFVGEAAKSMKDHIDLDSLGKKSSGRDFKEIAGSFWSAASVFSKKWQKWRRKQKTKKQERGGRSSMLPVVKPAGRHFRETQSEVADYGFGRHSCDTDPRFSLDAARFSLDAGRMSLDDPRHSFEMPRASWDGYLIGRSSFQRMPTIASVVEDSPPPARIPRTDMQIPVEMPTTMNSVNEDEAIPGGSAQTRDYYLDSSARRRKSLDRTNSIRKTAAAVVAEMDELKSVKNAKVTPATAEHYLQGTSKMTNGDKESLRDPIPNLNRSRSLRDDHTGTHMFDLAFNDTGFVVGNGDQKGMPKKSWRWGKGWNIWALIHRRAGGGHLKDMESNGRYGQWNGVVSRSYSESWQDLRGSEPNSFNNRRVLRSNSSVSSRNSSYNFNFGIPLGGMRKQGLETNGKKRRDEFGQERNRSARYPPNDIDNGLLRFYLTPMRGSRRGIVNGGGSNSAKGRANHAHSIARSMLRMY